MATATMRVHVLVAAALTLLLPLLPAEEGWYAESRTPWGGIPITVRFTPPDQALADRVWTYLDSIDTVFNDWKDTSEIGRINVAGQGRYRIGADLAAAFALSERMRTMTGGAFEITVGPLRRLWRGAEKSGVWPGEAELAQARAAIGPDTYALVGDQLAVKRPGVRFDFGGICKGMAVDRAVALLRAAGRTAALVQIGGETACWGIAPSGLRHRLAIPHPDRPDDIPGSWSAITDLGDGMCGSTSGNYRQPVVIGDRVCYHIYDPRSGLPSDTQVLSVSVLFAGAGRNGEADGLTKAGVVLGPPGLDLIAKAGGEAMMLVRGADGTIRELATPGWRRHESVTP